MTPAITAGTLPPIRYVRIEKRDIQHFGLTRETVMSLFYGPLTDNPRSSHLHKQNNISCRSDPEWSCSCEAFTARIWGFRIWLQLRLEQDTVLQARSGRKSCVSR